MIEAQSACRQPQVGSANQVITLTDPDEPASEANVKDVAERFSVARLKALVLYDRDRNRIGYLQALLELVFIPNGSQIVNNEKEVGVFLGISTYVGVYLVDDLLALGSRFAQFDLDRHV
jgi:hypothetical protein